MDTKEWPVGHVWYGVARLDENTFKWACPSCQKGYTYRVGSEGPRMDHCCTMASGERARIMRRDRDGGKLKAPEAPKPKKRGRKKAAKG